MRRFKHPNLPNGVAWISNGFKGIHSYSPKFKQREPEYLIILDLLQKLYDIIIEWPYNCSLSSDLILSWCLM